jgi:hypothetical protein
VIAARPDDHVEDEDKQSGAVAVVEAAAEGATLLPPQHPKLGVHQVLREFGALDVEVPAQRDAAAAALQSGRRRHLLSHVSR